MKTSFSAFLGIVILSMGLILGFTSIQSNPTDGNPKNSARVNPGINPEKQNQLFNQSDNNGGGYQTYGLPYYTDNFDGANDTVALLARNYLVYFRGVGDVQAGPTWFQGNDAVFPSFNGPTTGYVGSNYQVLSNFGDIDNWLVLPANNVAAGDSLVFYSRAPTGSIYPDSIRVMYSATGSTTPEQTWTELGRFVVNIAGVWERKAFGAPSAGATARFAIRYAVVDGGPIGDNSNYIGIDALTIQGPYPFNNDMKAEAFVTPLNGGSIGVGVPFSPQASYTNYGNNAQTNVTVRYKIINPSNSLIYNQTQLIASIGSGQTQTLTFPSTSLPSSGVFTIRAKSELVGDQNTTNDSISGTVATGNPLNGDYTIGLPLFNRLTGKNITFKEVVTKVEKNVFVVNKNISNDKNKQDLKKETEMTDGHWETQFVDEVRYVPMENGQEYNGRLYTEYTDNNSAVGHYSTLTAAVADLNALGATGPVRFLLTDATYPSETYPIVLNNWAGASATNTLTIQPNPGVASTFSGSATALLKLNGADYVTIDGLNTGGASLTFTNSNTGGADIWIGSASASNGASNNTVKNCVLNGPSIAALIVGSGTTFGNAGEAPNSNNTYTANTISAVQNALYSNGNASLDSNWAVTNNNVSGTAFRGFILINAFNGNISGNIINNVSSAATGSPSAGIFISGTSYNCSISKNQISNIINTNTGGYGAAGVVLGCSITSSNSTVSNNFIYGVRGYGWSGSAGLNDNGYGIIVNTGGGYNIYYNSISMNVSQTVNGLPSAINITSSVTTAGSLNIVDNIFSNTMTVGTNRYSIYRGGTDITAFNSINNNDNYYGTAPNLGFLNANVANLAAWKTATTRDTNSISGDPLFISNTNLHIDSSGSSPCNAAGRPIAGITTDIDGNTRNATTPDIGGDEFNSAGLPTNNVAVTAILNPLAGQNTLTGPTITPQATIQNVGTANQLSPFPITCTISPGGYSNTITDTLSAGLSRNKTFANFSPSVGVLYTVTVYTSLASDNNRSNDTLRQTSSFIFQNYGNDSGYFYANSLATTQPSFPKYTWKDTTGSISLVENTIQTSGTLVGTLDDGYFRLGLKNILLALGQDTTDKHLKYNGVCYDSIFPGTNGVVGLTEAYGTTSLSSFTVSATAVAKNALLALWHDMDLRFIGTGAGTNRLSYKAKGNQLIITYDKVGFYNSAAASPNWTSYQIVLEIVTGCGSGNSNFRYTYADTTTGQASGTFVSNYLNDYNAVPPATTTFGNFISGYSETGAPIAYGGYVSGGPLSVKRPLYNLATNRGLAVEFGPNANSLNEGDALILSVGIAIQGLQYSDPDVRRARDTVEIIVRDGSVAPYKIVQKTTVYLDSVWNGSYSYGMKNIDFSLLKRNYPYYLEVRNRQTLESWSNQVSTNGDTLKYDFTTSVGQTFGSNSILTNGPASFYSGDITSTGDGIPGQDGTIDLADVTKVFNDASAFLSGEGLLSDLNQDGEVDLTDLTIVYNNSNGFVTVIRPAGAAPAPYEAPVVYERKTLNSPVVVTPDPYLAKIKKTETGN